MAAYLIVDVDDVLQRFRQRGIAVDLQELAVGLRGGAALAAGLVSADKLKAVAVANWEAHTPQVHAKFKAAGYDTFDVAERDSMADALIMHYFSFDPDPVDELILATTSQDLIPLARRVKTTRNARIRVWGSEDVLKGTEFAASVIFQPLESLLGIQTKNVAVYVDFENIAISLNEQGFTVNLDHLIDRIVMQAKAHGHVVSMAAYAPWGQRGSLPPLVDSQGREVMDEAPSRLMLANIDPVFNLPGKNSADMRIARDVITDAGHSDSADVYILASGDRDFNEVLNALLSRNKTVIVWGVRGSTSRQLEKNPGVSVEYIDDFTNLQTHQSLSTAAVSEGTEAASFTPSQWTSVIVQFDRMATELNIETIPARQLIEQLQRVGAVISRPRGEDLVSQALSLGLLKAVTGNGNVTLNPTHPIVEKTRIIRDRIVRRVENTLEVRGWEYVNYGFLLKGLAMDKELDRPGCNENDQWRSHWIDALVREQVLARELVPHRHNPDDLVPVIKLRSDYQVVAREEIKPVAPPPLQKEWAEMTIDELGKSEQETVDMIVRVVVSVEQFTSFRGFAWCPLGSLHRRLRAYDTGMTFQRAVEYLIANNAAEVNEYPNPQSNYSTKGITLLGGHALLKTILAERDAFIKLLLQLYDKNMLISEANLRTADPQGQWDLELWFSIMVTENVLNPLPGRAGQYSLFRTHHTVNLVAGTPE
ncbi:MAG: NYN domain-containing protein [Chloroflexi bacterium]|nr:NYN domain-containing protein [Chloroflexota bacterium]